MDALPKVAYNLGGHSEKVRVRAFAKSLKRAGYRVKTVVSDCLYQFDLKHSRRRGEIAFTCGMQPRYSRVRERMAQIGIPLIVLDCGYFRRANDQGDAKGYNQAGIGRLCWTPKTAPDSSRWDALGLEVAQGRERKQTYILALGQVPGDTQHHLSREQMLAWLETTAAERARKTGLPIRFRAHPKFPKMVMEGVEQCDPSRPLSADMDDCAEIVTYNSTSGVEAMLSAVPVHCHPSAHYSAHVNGNYMQRLAYAHRLAWAQWTAKEIEEGKALDFLRTQIDTPEKP